MESKNETRGGNNVHQPTFEFLAPPKGDLPPRCCARCKNALYVYDKRFGGMHLRCMDVSAREYFGVNHPKDFAPDCAYFVRETPLSESASSGLKRSVTPPHLPQKIHSNFSGAPDNPYKIPNMIKELW